MPRGTKTQKTTKEDREIKVFYNEEVPDQPLPEVANLEELKYQGGKLKDLNLKEGRKLTGIDEGAMNLTKYFKLFTWFESGDGFGTFGNMFIYNGGMVKSITAATAGSYNEFYKMLYTSYASAFNWDKKRICKWSVGFQNGGQTNCEQRIVTGVIQSLTSHHIGFKIVNGLLYGTVADGTTETSVYLRPLSNNFFYVLEVRLYPAEKVEFYVNNDYYATITTNLPSGTMLAEWLLDWHVITNEAVSKEGWLSWMDIWQEM